MKTLRELLDDISYEEDITFPLILMQGNTSHSVWNYTTTDNTIDCSGLTHCPGSGNVLSCCHRLNPELHGISPAFSDILDANCDDYPEQDYTNSRPDGKYDCCATTKYKGILKNATAVSYLAISFKQRANH